MQHTMMFNNARVHYSTVDAVFRALDGRPISMEFHRYCGPMFFTREGDDYMPEEDTPEWDNLWHQFNGWNAAVNH